MRLANQNGLNQKDVAIFSKYKEKAYAAHKRMPSVLSWSKDGKFLITAQKYIRVWELSENYELQKYGSDTKGHDTLIDDLKFFDNHLFGSMSRDQIKFWDLRQGITKPIRQQKKTKDDFISFTWNHGDKPSYTILNKDNCISLHDLRDGNNNSQIKSIKSNIDVLDILWDPSDSVLLCAGQDGGKGVVTMLNSQLQLIPEIMELHAAKINSIAIDRNNYYLATCSDDSMIQLYQMPQFLCMRTYSNSEYPYKKVSFSNSGQYFSASTAQPYIDIFNAWKGGHAFRVKTTNIQQQLEWHPHKPILAYIDEDQKRKGLTDRSQEFVKIFSPY